MMPREPSVPLTARAVKLMPREGSPSPIPGAHVPTGQTGAVVANITYGNGIPGEAELRLCGDLADAKRAVELGVSEWLNSIAFARAGARAIAVDPRHDRIALLRERAEQAEVTVQCHETAMADLGAITSGTCDAVVAAHTLADVDDLGRVLRQVHRILQPSMPFVISVPHPFVGVGPDRHYGIGQRSIGEWFTALGRANFRVDQVIELGVGNSGPIPTTLILRARKEGS
jgi:SAM-dependent methyltransferase